MKKIVSALAITTVATLGICSQALAGDENKSKDKGAMFEKWDKDGNGSVSKEEYSDAMKDKGKDEEKIDKSFSKKDADGDGKLSKAEMEAGKEHKTDRE